MPRSALAVTILLVGSSSLSCRRDAPRPAAAAPQDTGFVGTMAPLDRARPRQPGAATRLRAVDAVTGQGYDRIVFEFAGDSVPGYHVEYARGPVRRCGSGDPVPLAGNQALVVRFGPARAHDDQGNPAPTQRDRVLGLSAVKELKLVCDFEGQVAWVLGVAAAAPYRVSELATPARLMLDVRHGP